MERSRAGLIGRVVMSWSRRGSIDVRPAIRLSGARRERRVEVREVGHRGEIGDARDAVGRQPAAHHRQVGQRPRRKAVAQPAVEPEQATGQLPAVVALDAGVVDPVVDAGALEAGGVEDPRPARAVLDADRPLADRSSNASKRLRPQSFAA